MTEDNGINEVEAVGEMPEAQSQVTLDHDSAIDLGDLHKFLTFKVDKEEYGIDLMQIREIKGWTETTRVPNTPKFMSGVINLRGAVIPVFDLRNRFDMGTTEPTIMHVVIIVAVGKGLSGILVDAVSDILEIPETEIKEAPKMDTKIDDVFVDGLISVQEKMVILLNVEELFNTESYNKSEESRELKNAS